MNQSFDDDDGDLDFVAECDSDIDVSDSVFTLDYGDDGLLLIDTACDDIEPLQISTESVDHHDEIVGLSHIICGENIVNGHGNESCSNNIIPPTQIVHLLSPQYRIDSSNDIEKQLLQFQLASVRYENCYLRAQFACMQFCQSVYWSPPPQPMMNNYQTYDGAVTVIGESQIGTSKLGRPKGSADIQPRGPRPCALCQVYEIKSANEQSNVFTCKGRMGGKKGGRKACQYFFLDGTSKGHLPLTTIHAK